jgi:hypothetical protein
MAGEGATQVASGVVDALKQQPMALALVVINVLFLGAGGWFMGKIAERVEQRDGMIMQMLKDCRPSG